MSPRWITVPADADTDRLVKRLTKQAGRQVGVKVRTVRQIAAVDPDTGEATDLAFGLVVGATRGPFDQAAPMREVPTREAPDDPVSLTNPHLTNPALTVPLTGALP